MVDDRHPPWLPGGLLLKCETCDGQGYIDAEYADGTRAEERACRRCRGSAVVPSEEGRQILGLIQWERIFGK